MTPTDPSTSLSQAAQRLEQSRDAVAALRKAMEARLADIAPAPLPPEESNLESVTTEEVLASFSADAAPKEAPPDENPKTAAPENKAESPLQDEPLSFDPVEWSHIMMHVAQRSQQLLRDYIARMRHKPLDTSPLALKPVFDSLSQLSSQILNDPDAYTHAQLTTWQNYIDLTRATLRRMQGIKPQPIAEADKSDKRFKGTDWQTNWIFDFLKQAYLKTVEESQRLVRQEAAHTTSKTAQRIEFYSRLFFDASAPNNFWLTNPEVLRVTLQSKGENLIKGLKNLLQDLEDGKGMLRIKMSDYKAFEPGKNIACTPGKVIYQNDLMQLIQYAPTTTDVKRVPLLIIPPWINKYYILDLRQKNSFIRHLVDQGFTVFCISWVNPTKQYAETQFEDYMDLGSLTALREIKRLTGEDNANVLGYCIGGTLLSCLQAYLAAAAPRSDLPKITSATYLVTMVDFSEPGDLGVFIDEDQIQKLEERMQRQGFLDAGSMMMAFNMLRANDLIWPFVINNYMLGREPFPFDILYWNTDSTNLPAAMQSYYLRNMYLNNRLVLPKALSMRGMPIDLSQITTPSFVLATREDHIAPWRSTYEATQIYKGPVTFVLSGSGHIAGIVNPPESNKYGYWTHNAPCPADAQEWLKEATEHKGSWWPEWIKWLTPYSGENIPARDIVKGIEDAPGSYVKVRVV